MYKEMVINYTYFHDPFKEKSLHSIDFFFLNNYCMDIAMRCNIIYDKIRLYNDNLTFLGI